MMALRMMSVLGVLGGALGVKRCPTPAPGLCSEHPPNCTSPCDPDCGCLAKMGYKADPDSDPPKECYGTPGIAPLGPPNVPSTMTFTSSETPPVEYVWSLCGDVAKDLVGWQCRIESSDPAEDGRIDMDKTEDVWRGGRSCPVSATCRDETVSGICAGFTVANATDTSATDCAGVATHYFSTFPRTSCTANGEVNVRAFTQDAQTHKWHPVSGNACTSDAQCRMGNDPTQQSGQCGKTSHTCAAAPGQSCTKDCSVDPRQLGCTGCSWSRSRDGGGSCTGKAETLCDRAFEAAPDDRQSSCATGSAGFDQHNQPIPGCTYRRMDWTRGKCANEDGTPFMSSILKQGDIDLWQSTENPGGNYTGRCQGINDNQGKYGSGSGPDDWPDGTAESTELQYGGASGFSLVIQNYKDGTGLDIKGAASKACAPGSPQPPCSVLRGGTMRTVYVNDDLKPAFTKDQVSACPDAGCGTGAAGGLPVLFVFALMAVVGVGVGQKVGAFDKFAEQTGDVAFHTAPH